MTTNLARAIKVIDRTAEKVGTRAPLLAQALKRANLLVPDAPVEYLIKDDQREDLAEQLYEAFPHPTSVAGAWGGLPREHRERWRRVADVAIRWFGEQTAS